MRRAYKKRPPPGSPFVYHGVYLSYNEFMQKCFIAIIYMYKI